MKHHESSTFRSRGVIMLATVIKFLKSEDGPTAVEYAVMLALIVIVCLTAIKAVGNNANARFNQVSSELT
jgi:pilus assembly protein Flp/PilA